MKLTSKVLKILKVIFILFFSVYFSAPVSFEDSIISSEIPVEDLKKVPSEVSIKDADEFNKKIFICVVIYFILSIVFDFPSVQPEEQQNLLNFVNDQPANPFVFKTDG
jgi:hypothetical protein